MKAIEEKNEKPEKKDPIIKKQEKKNKTVYNTSIEIKKNLNVNI